MTSFHEETKKVIRHLKRRLITLIDTTHSQEVLKSVISDYLDRLLQLGPSYIEGEEGLHPAPIQKYIPSTPNPVYPFTGRDPRNLTKKPPAISHITVGNQDRHITSTDRETFFHGIRIPAGSDVVELPSVKPHVRDFFYVNGNVRHFVSIDDRAADDTNHQQTDHVHFHSSCPHGGQLAARAEVPVKRRVMFQFPRRCQHSSSVRRRLNLSEENSQHQYSQELTCPEDDSDGCGLEFHKRPTTPAVHPNARPIYPSCGPWSCTRRNSCLDPEICNQESNMQPQRNENFQIPAEQEEIAAAQHENVSNPVQMSAEECVAKYEQCLRQKYDTMIGKDREDEPSAGMISKLVDETAVGFEKLLQEKYSLDGEMRTGGQKDLKMQQCAVEQQETQEKQNDTLDASRFMGRLDERQRALGLEFPSVDCGTEVGDETYMRAMLEMPSSKSETLRGKDSSPQE